MNKFNNLAIWLALAPFNRTTAPTQNQVANIMNWNKDLILVFNLKNPSKITKNNKRKWSKSQWAYKKQSNKPAPTNIF